MEIAAGIILALICIAVMVGVAYYLVMKIVDSLGDSVDATLDKGRSVCGHCYKVMDGPVCSCRIRTMDLGSTLTASQQVELDLGREKDDG